MQRLILVFLGLLALATAQSTKDLSVINARVDYNHQMILTIRNDGTADTTAKVSFKQFPHEDPHAQGGSFREKLVEVPADTTLDVTFYGKVQLEEFCNLFMAKIECTAGSMLQETNPDDNILVFRICKRSDVSKGAAQMVSCEGLEHLMNQPDDFARKCAKRASKECKVECCREEAHTVDDPQCCLLEQDFTESKTYLDEFDVVSYGNSDGSADWAGKPWVEGSFFGFTPANLEDGQPETGRIRIENGDLVMACGDSSTCDLGCLVEEPMFIYRGVEVPSCIADTSTLRIGMRYSYAGEEATLRVFQPNGVVLGTFPLPPVQGGSIDVELQVSFDYELVIVEIEVPVSACNAPVDMRIGILQVKHTCSLDNVECPMEVDVCGTCGGLVVNPEVCDDGKLSFFFLPLFSTWLSLSSFKPRDSKRSLRSKREKKSSRKEMADASRNKRNKRF